MNMCRVCKYSPAYIAAGEPSSAYHCHVGTTEDVGKVIDDSLILSDGLTKETNHHFPSIDLYAVDVFESNRNLIQNGISLIGKHDVYGETRYLYLVDHMRH